MISNGENWHYLAVKSLSRLLRGITSNHDGDYYCLILFSRSNGNMFLKEMFVPAFGNK